MTTKKITDKTVKSAKPKEVEGVFELIQIVRMNIFFLKTLSRA